MRCDRLGLGHMYKIPGRAGLDASAVMVTAWERLKSMIQV